MREIDYDLVVAINEEVAGDSAGVTNEAGIRGALGRVRSGFEGVETFPTILEKAAALLHGLSSTQYFLDGNKRTAWAVAKLFLGLNGVYLRPVDGIQAESMVTAVAVKAFEREHEQLRGIEKAAEWFEHARFRMVDRVEFVFLANEADSRGDGEVFDAKTGGLDKLHIPSVPAIHCVPVVLSLIPHPSDAGREHRLQARVMGGASAFSSPLRIIRDEECVIPPEYVNPRVDGRAGFYPIRVVWQLWLEVRDFVEGSIELSLDGETVGRLPLWFVPRTEAPDDLSSL
ncbi:type II toxin-antitoxin system death-on-curing family toxin [Microbacterium sp. NPDC007973]|uniref:type II toxin-antitoxin system death-on-curing family toxin n=1 Tax=Microbacterium sp. NPDC007973 TaxID=3364182 RepID=UPI0036EA0AFE